MKEIEIIDYVVRGEMPDLEQIRANCHKQFSNEILTNDNAQKKRQLFKPVKIKILATALALILVVGLFNVQAIINFMDLFFIPGIGLTVNPNLVSAVLDEPILIEANGIEYRLEFATKVKRENGRCEIMFFFSANHQGQVYDFPPAVAIVNGREYNLRHDRTTALSVGVGDETYETFVNFTVSKYRFPDVNEFELRLENTTVNITLSELTEEEKRPNLSAEINGVTLAAYRYKNNNSIIGFDVLNKNMADTKFEVAHAVNFPVLYDIDGNILNNGSNYGLANTAKTKDGFGLHIVGFNNKANKDIHKIDVTSIDIRYSLSEKSWINIPVPKDGETIHTDIKIPIVDGIVYELTSIRRDGDKLYIEDNTRLGFPPRGDELQEAVNNNEIGIRASFNAGFDVDNGIITDFDPTNLQIHTFYLIYYGDFTFTFD